MKHLENISTQSRYCKYKYFMNDTSRYMINKNSFIDEHNCNLYIIFICGGFHEY